MAMIDLQRCIRSFIGEIYLLISVLFFGVAFVVMRYAMFYKLGPQSFNAGRFFIASLCLFATKWSGFEFPTFKPTASVGVRQKQSLYTEFVKTNNLLWGSALGVLNFIGTAFMQGGLTTVDANRAGFIVGMYVVFVPFVETCVPGMQTKLTSRAIVAALMSLFGLYLMSGCAEAAVCMGEIFGDGEILMFLSMFVWVVFIICGTIGSRLVDPLLLTMTNFIVATICSVGCALLFEPEEWIFPYTAFTDELFVLTAVGVLQAGGFALSTVGQRYTTSTIAALIMAQDTVVCALVSYFALNETLSAIEVCGCITMIAATAVAVMTCGDRPSSGSSSTEDIEERSPLGKASILDGPFEDSVNLLEKNTSFKV